MPNFKKHTGYQLKPKFLKSKVTKTDKGYTKRAGASKGWLGIRNKTDRKYTGEVGKSMGAQVAGMGAAIAAGASGGAVVGVGLAAGGARIAGNKIQQAVARRRVKKYGQKGSAIVPNEGSKYMRGEKALVGEKTRTHKDAAAGRKSARSFRKSVKAQNKANKALDKRDKFAARVQKSASPAVYEESKSGSMKSPVVDTAVKAYKENKVQKPKMLKKKRKDVAGKTMMAYAKPAMYGDKPKSTLTFLPDKKRIKTVTGPEGTGGHYTMTKTTKRKVKIKEVSKKRAARIAKKNSKRVVRDRKK